MDKRKIKKKIKKYHWAILLIITIFIAMYVYGMTAHYFPEPLHIGFGQYIDIATGITIVSLIFAGVILTIIFKTRKKVVSASEYQAVGSKNKK